MAINVKELTKGKSMKMSDEDIESYFKENYIKCDDCGMTDHKECMYPLGYDDKYLCTECFSYEEDDYDEY